MRCMYCGSLDSKVVDSRSTDDGTAIRRRRECLNCAGRPVPLQTIDSMITEIESSLHNSLQREVSSEKIGEMVMDMLRDIDEVAYVRFASVYKQFKDIETFQEELKKLSEKRG